MHLLGTLSELTLCFAPAWITSSCLPHTGFYVAPFHVQQTASVASAHGLHPCPIYLQAFTNYQSGSQQLSTCIECASICCDFHSVRQTCTVHRAYAKTCLLTWGSSVLQLAPGGHLGRFIIWTKSAFDQLDSIFGELLTSTPSDAACISVII